jgi:hypothetical protein
MNISGLFRGEPKGGKLFDNSTEITKENIAHLSTLALARVENFWKKILPRDLLPKFKLVLHDNTSNNPELHGAHDTEIKTNELSSFVSHSVSGTAYLHFENFLILSKKNNIPVNSLTLTLALLHESVHAVQAHMDMLTVDLMDEESDIFGLEETVADQIMGCFFYFCKLHGKTQLFDYYRSLNFMNKTCVENTDVVEDKKTGHAGPKEREENFKYGYSLSRKAGTKMAVMKILKDMELKIVATIET